MGPIGCCPITGWAAANACCEIGLAATRTGRDPVMMLAGTEVAAARLAKLLMATLLLIVVASLT